MTFPRLTILGHRFPLLPSLQMSDRELTKHLRIQGPALDERQRLIASLLGQQAKREGGWIFFISGHDTQLLSELQSCVVHAGRADKFFVLDLVQAHRGNTYSPLLALPPSEAAQRLTEAVARPTADPLLKDKFRLLVQAIYDYGNRRGLHPDIGELCRVLEAPQTYLHTIAKDRICREALANAQLWQNDGPCLALLDQIWNTVRAEMSAMAFDRSLRAFDLPHSQLNVQALLATNSMLCVVLPTAEDTARAKCGDVLSFFLEDLLASLPSRRANKERAPSFLLAFDDLDSLTAPLVNPTAPSKSIASIKHLFDVARSYNTGIIAGCSTARSPHCLSLSRAIEAQTAHKIWLAGLSKEEVRRAERLMGSPEAQAAPNQRIRLPNIQPGSVVFYAGERPTVWRLTRASKQANEAFRPYTHKSLVVRDDLHLPPARPTVHAPVDLDLS